MTKKTSRRKAFQLGLMGVISLPFFKALNLYAEENGNGCKNKTPTDETVLNRIVREDDPAAKRLDYVEIASDSEHPNFKAGELCKNCRFFRVQQEKEGWAPCTMLANRYVAPCGWCRSYQPMPS